MLQGVQLLHDALKEKVGELQSAIPRVHVHALRRRLTGAARNQRAARQPDVLHAELGEDAPEQAALPARGRAVEQQGRRGVL